MKKLYLKLIFLFIFLIPDNIYPQEAWVQQNSGTDKYIKTCYFINSFTGFTAGKGGLILRTTNGGTNWETSYKDDIHYFTSVFFINNKTGWSLGVDEEVYPKIKIVIKTTDCGQSWAKKIIDSCGSLFSDDVYFINELTGFITGCNLKRSTDGGISWNIFYDTLTSSIYFLNDKTGWIGGNTIGVSKTTNGGLDWFRQMYFLPHHYDSEIYFMNEETGFFIHHSSGSLYTTTNNGVNWIHFYTPNFLSSIFFADQNTGYMLANYIPYVNYIAKSTDKGSSWSFLYVKSTKHLSHLFFTSAKTGWIVGDSGLILKTLNGGIIPDEILFYQNYPNPFNSSTIIKFNIPVTDQESFVSIDIFDIIGRKVTTLVNENYKAGTHEVRWDVPALPSGIYFSRISVLHEGITHTKTSKMVLIK